MNLKLLFFLPSLSPEVGAGGDEGDGEGETVSPTKALSGKAASRESGGHSAPNSLGLSPRFLQPWAPLSPEMLR